MEVLRKALFVTPFAPLPAVEGHRKRMSATIEALRSLGFQIDILMLALEHDWVERFDSRIFNAMRAMAATFHFVRGRLPEPLLEGSYGVDEWWHPEFEDYANWLFRNVSYDLVLGNYVFTSRVMELARRNTVRVIETHDLFAGRRAMLEAHGLRVEFYHTDAENEAKGLRRADLVLAIKEQEEATFRAYGVSEVLTLPYVEPTMFVEAPPPRQATGAAPIFGYFASRNQINVRNFLEFMETVERLRQPNRPPLDIRAYGSICDILPEDPRGRYRRGGRVGDASEFYAAVDCVIVPQHFSTGLKIKIGEALAQGRPIISHEHAFEGFGTALNDALACGSFEEMVRRMYQFSDDADAADALTEAVRQTQLRQVAQLNESTRAIGVHARRSRQNLLLMVDGVALRRDKLYRFVLEAVSAAFVGHWRVVLAVPKADFRALSDDDLVGASSVIIGYDDPAELHRPELCGFDWAGVLVFDRPGETWSALSGFRGCPVFIAEDAAVYLAAMAGDAAAPADRLEARRLRSGAAAGAMGGTADDDATADRRTLRVRFLRWSPWFFEIGRSDGGYTHGQAVWVLSCAGRAEEARMVAGFLTSRLKLRVQVFCAGADRDAADAVFAPAAQAYREAFQKLTAPLGVIDLAGDAPVFGLLREWLSLNHVPHLELLDWDDDSNLAELMTRASLRGFISRMMGEREAPPDRPPRTLDWTTSGWGQVLHTLRSFVA